MAKIMNATATEARQNFYQLVTMAERGEAHVQIIRHERVVAVMVSPADAAKLWALKENEARKVQQEAASYSEKERAEIDRRIWDPAIRALMGLPPLSAAAIEALGAPPSRNDRERLR